MKFVTVIRSLPSQEWDNSDLVGIITYCILLISFSINILIYCYIGEMLMEQVFLIRVKQVSRVLSLNFTIVFVSVILQYKTM